MNLIAEVEACLAKATDLPAVLDVAYDAFEGMLAVLRCHQEDDEGALPALVLAACAAANGRDWIAGAPALPRASSRKAAQTLLEDATVTDVAFAIAALSGEVATRLAAHAESPANAEDRACCEHAATEAVTIQAILGGASPP